MIVRLYVTEHFFLFRIFVISDIVLNDCECAVFIAE